MERQIVEHRENRLSVGSGIGMLCVLVLGILLAAAGVALFGIAGVIPVVVCCAASIPVLIFLLFGLFMVHPNEVKVLQLFGDYRGSVYDTAGVEVIEARISHLAYAAEIAAAMLQRQQAAAVVAARAQIVDGAVGMVEQALTMLSEKNVVHLDDERKAAMVGNLLAVLCSDRHTQPVVNTGTLYP